jgi:hypothetical protein
MVDFHTDENLYSVRGNMSPTDDVLQVVTNKTLKSIAGTFSITLAGHHWYNLLRPQDVVTIQMGRRPGTLGTVMVGLIDGVYKTRTVNASGATVRGTRIEGRDFGKVFLKAFIKWFPQFGVGEGPMPDGIGDPLLKLQEFYTQHSFQIGSPASLIKNAVSSLLFNIMNFEMKYYQGENLVNTSLNNVLRYRLGKTSNIIPFMTTMDEFEGSLWNYMQATQNAPFYELYLDTCTDEEALAIVPETKVEAQTTDIQEFTATFGEDRAKVILFLRKTPFDKEDWQNLKTHVLTADDDIVGEDIGRSDHENYNLFLATHSMDVLGENALAALVRPEFNEDNIKRYGLSPLEIKIEGVFNDDNITDRVLKEGENLTKTLKRWFQDNDKFESGTLTIRGREEIKIGQRVLHTGFPTMFYVEGVQHEFVNLKAFKTTLTVTRGTSPNAIESSSTETINVVYTVQNEDTPWSLAVRFYNDGDKYQMILDANPHIVPQVFGIDKSSVQLKSGQVIIIPDAINREG